MKHCIVKIFDAADSVGAKITSITSNDTFSIVHFEKDYVQFQRVIAHTDTFDKIVTDIHKQSNISKGIILNKKD